MKLGFWSETLVLETLTETWARLHDLDLTFFFVTKMNNVSILHLPVLFIILIIISNVLVGYIILECTTH